MNNECSYLGVILWMNSNTLTLYWVLYNIWPKIYRQLNMKITPIFDYWASHFKTMDINLLLKQPPFFWGGFSQDFGPWLQTPAVQHWCWEIGLVSQPAFQFQLDGVEIRALRWPHQTRKTISSSISFCDETENGLTLTPPQSHYCLKHHGIL